MAMAGLAQNFAPYSVPVSGNNRL